MDIEGIAYTLGERGLEGAAAKGSGMMEASDGYRRKGEKGIQDTSAVPSKIQTPGRLLRPILVG